MTKDDLVEALARSEAERCERDPAIPWSWQDDDMAEFRAAWRTRVRPLVPAVRDFVAEWMASFVHEGFFTTDQIDEWREDMA